MPRLTTAVWRHRRQQMNDLMDALRLDALVFTSADFFQFATNFHTDVLPWERPIYAVVPRDGDGFLVMNELSTNHMRFSREQGKVWITDVSFYAEHPRLVERLPLPSELPELLAQRLARAGLARARVGVEGGSPALTAAAAQLPDLRLLLHPRMPRAALAQARGRTRGDGGDRFAGRLVAGTLPREHPSRAAGAGAGLRDGRAMGAGSRRALSGRAVRGDPGLDAERPGVRVAAWRWRVLRARIREGDVLVNILIPRLNGLAIENERTWFCGRPSAEQAALWTAARDANLAGIEAAVSGQPVSGIDAAAQAVIERAGYAAHIRHRTGHAIGIIHHEYPENMAFCHRPLEDNEVYSVEPGLYVYGIGGFRIDDTVVVGREPRTLTATPKTLDHATVL